MKKVNKKAPITGITGQDGNYYEGLWRGFEFLRAKLPGLNELSARGELANEYSN